MKKIPLTKSLAFLIAFICAINFGFGQTTLAKEDLAIIGVNTDNEDFTFVLRTDITIGTQIYFSDNEVNTGGTGLNDTNEGIILFTASTNYSCGSVIGFLANSGEFTNVFGSFILANGGDEVLAFQGYNPVTLAWTTFLHANVDLTITYPVGFTAADIVDGNRDNREYMGSTSNPTWADLNIFANYNHENFYGGVTLSTIAHTCSPCPTTITWNGTWSNGTGPDLTTEAILNASYNTATNGGSFSACSLSVSNGATLNIANNDYIEVENELTVDAGGLITVQPYGAFIQNNDASINSISGNITVTKKTAPMNNWYEYTYWSSPVSGEMIQDGLFESQFYRRFAFNGSLFNDELAETGNSNAFVTGQDDIDDEGDDWYWVNPTTVMQPGVGYASTHDESAFVGPPFSSPPYQFDYTFEGAFNNGVYNVTVNRNDATTADFNWNFIGNPYPSPIEVDAFMTRNMYDATTNPTGTLDGAIYYWSQNTDKANNANGDEAYNFATSDYARKNGASSTAGGDGLSPNDFIPSGQGFFVSFSDSASSSTGTVVFNNSMRSLSLSPDNSQFFKSSNYKKKSNVPDNKLWIDLTSDNGVYNQISIAYVNGATDNDDGAYYDAHKIVAPTAYAALYSIIESSSKKFAIQGKNPNSLDEDEIVKLGFATNITVPTLYKLSMAQIQGDFLNNNPVYLKDNLLNTTHDLSASDYSFTSEVGEFNNRFEIGYSAAALSTDEFAVNSNSLRIIELDNNRVQFSASDNLSIQNVSIYDLLGRQLYDLKGRNSTEVYTLSNLSSTIYIAKVALSNGTVITKKAVKK